MKIKALRFRRVKHCVVDKVQEASQLYFKILRNLNDSFLGCAEMETPQWFYGRSGDFQALTTVVLYDRSLLAAATYPC